VALFRPTIVAAALLVAAAPGTVHASNPVAGGLYSERSREDGVRVRIVLTLANDGREFARPSRANFRIGCAGNLGPYLGSWFGRPHAAQVLPGGRFRRGSLRGRFVRNGRLAVGTFTWSGSRGCPPRVIPFRARLTGAPNASRPGVPSRCDFIVIRYSRRKGATDGFRLVEQGLGCTRARRIARRWRTSRECAALTAPGQACIVGKVTCETIAGGAWRPLAGIRCALPEDRERATELVHQRPCLQPHAEGDFTLWVINLDCATARAYPFDDPLDCAWDPSEPSGWYPCASHAGYTCTLRDIPIGAGSGVRGSCVEDRTGYRAFEYIEDFGV
jgi:hypothetical protein